MINMIYKQYGQRPVRISITKDSKPFRTGKDRFTATFYGRDSSEPLFVCLASRRQVSHDPPVYKMSYCPHDSRNLLVEERFEEECAFGAPSCEEHIRF